MKVALVCSVFFVVVAVSYAALTCMTDEGKCGPDECCVKFGMIGRCKPRLAQGARCEIKSGTHILKKHVYLRKCPCGEGLKCASTKNGIVGKFLGTCESSDDSGDGGDGSGEDGGNGGGEDGGNDGGEDGGNGGGEDGGIDGGEGDEE